MGRVVGRRAGEQGVIYHCQEMCCTQQDRLSSLLLLQLELQILKRCRTCTSQITIHHVGSRSQEETPSHVRLSCHDFSSRNVENGNFWGARWLSQAISNLDNLLRFGVKIL